MSGIIKKISLLAPDGVLSLHELAEDGHARKADQLRARIKQLEADLALRDRAEDSLRQEIEDAFARGQSKGLERTCSLNGSPCLRMLSPKLRMKSVRL
jgi:hypothetical protein